MIDKILLRHAKLRQYVIAQDGAEVRWAPPRISSRLGPAKNHPLQKAITGVGFATMPSRSISALPNYLLRVLALMAACVSIAYGETRFPAGVGNQAADTEFAVRECDRTKSDRSPDGPGASEWLPDGRAVFKYLLTENCLAPFNYGGYEVNGNELTLIYRLDQSDMRAECNCRYELEYRINNLAPKPYALTLRGVNARVANPGKWPGEVSYDAEQEKAHWDRVKGSRNPADYLGYLEKFSGAPHAAFARWMAIKHGGVLPAAAAGRAN